MKTLIAIIVSVLLIGCNATKQSSSIATAEQKTEVKEEPKQVFIPANALEIDEPIEIGGNSDAPPPPPPPPSPNDEPLFKVVEQMPRFPGCESEPGDERAKELCAKDKMLEYVYSNLVYPEKAKLNGVEGTVVTQFTVETSGFIADIKIVRDPGAGCGEAAKAVLESMNSLPEKWTPGMQRGRPVKVQYTFPVRFKLDSASRK